MTTMQSLSALFKQPVFKGTKAQYLPWKMKFKMHLSQAGCLPALSDKIAVNFTACESDVDVLDEKDPSNQAPILAVKQNAMTMGALVLALEGESDMMYVIIKQQSDPDWPTGKAYKVWERLEEEYQPDDITSDVEMKRELMKIKLGESENPKLLMSRLAKVEATYRMAIPEDDKRAIVWEAGSGKTYGAMILMTNEMAKAKSSKAATASELCAAMHRQWRLEGHDDTGDAGVETGETTLAVTGLTFTGKCFLCNKTGHRKSDCPTKTKTGETAAAVVSGENLSGKKKFAGNCNFCDKKGHREADCWKKFPEKMPEKFKEKAAATVDSELLVCSLDGYYGGEIEGQRGEESAASFLEARLRAIMSDPSVYVCGQTARDDRVGHRMMWEDTKTAASAFSTTISKCDGNTESKESMEKEWDTRVEPTDMPIFVEQVIVKEKATFAMKKVLLDPPSGNDELPQWVWKTSKGNKPRKTWRLVLDADGNIKQSHEKLVLAGAPSEDASVLEDVNRRRWWETCGGELCLAAQLSFPVNEELLHSPSIWIGDSGASMHVSFSQVASTNMRASEGHTHGVAGTALKFSGLMDIPCIKCDKHGNEEFPLTLTDVNYLKESNFNLFSTTKLLSQGWKLTGDSTCMELTLGGRTLRFDIVVKTRRGVVFCAYLKRKESGEVAGLAIDKGTLTVEKAHQLLGHCYELPTRKLAKHYLDWTLTKGGMKPCESCATGKSRQKNVPTVSAGVKATVPNGRWFHDQSMLKPPEGVQGQRKVWDMSVGEYTGAKFTAFYSTKNEYIEPYCEKLQTWKSRGKPVLIIRQDNAGENKAMQARVQSADWKLDITFEYTAPGTPQQNSLVERAFAEVASKARTMLNAANVPHEYHWKLFPEAAITVVKLDWLTVITREGVTKSKIEFYDRELPRFTKHLRVWGEAGTVKLPKNGKVNARGVTCVFIGYATDHEGDCYRMWNPTTGMVMLSRDVVFLQRMFFEKENAATTMAEPVVFVPGGQIANIRAEENELNLLSAKLVTTTEGEPTPSQAVTFADGNESEHENESEHDTEEEDGPNKGFTTVPHTTRSGRVITRPNRLIETAAVAAVQNYYACLEEYDEEEMALTTEVANAVVDEISGVGAGLGGGFDNTKELCVMKYDEAVNGPDGKAWNEEVDKEHGRMVKNKAWVAVAKTDLPPGTIPIDSTWAMKKKSNGTLRGRLNARGFKQIEGVHYDGSSIHAPVTNSATI